jgi:hypothetical protein
LFHTLAVGVHHRQIGLRLRCATLGCLQVALQGLREILRHALAVGIHQAQVVERCELEIGGVVGHGLRLRFGVEWPQRTGATVAKTPCGIMPFALVLKRDLCEEYKLRVFSVFYKKI